MQKLDLIFLASTIALLAHQSSCLQWTTHSNGEIPIDAFRYVAPKTRLSLHFCEIIDPNSGRIHTGMIAKGENVCEFVDTETQEVGVSSVYKVLRIEKGEKIGWEWAYHGEVPANAIACEDTHIGGSQNCYLGVSMYSDGICKEAIGKIDSTEGMIHMSVNKESRVCPFFLYLTKTPVVSGVDYFPRDRPLGRPLGRRF